VRTALRTGRRSEAFNGFLARDDIEIEGRRTID